MSRQNKNRTPSPMSDILDEPEGGISETLVPGDDRAILKMQIALVVFQDQYQLRGLAGMLKIKKTLTKSIIEDVKAAMEIVDEIYDA